MNSILFVQNAPHRAGAQTCLARLASHLRSRNWQPIVLCSSAGWLTEECERRGIPYLIEPFPRSRSMTARLFGNANFAKRVKTRLDRLGQQPVIVQANDHWEGLLGIQLAGALSARSAIFLRTSRVTRDQYFKYQCDRYDLIATIGATLQAKAQRWNKKRHVSVYYDGIEQNDLQPPLPKSANTPRNLLVIGAPRSSKGWADLVAALEILARSGKWLPQRVDFTGRAPTVAENDLKLERVPGVQFRFLGHVNEFSDLVREYQLVVNPSRIDSFGMAAVETIAAGVPLLSSRTGVLDQIIAQDFMLFAPGKPDALAEALGFVATHWNELDFDQPGAQNTIARKFSIDQSGEMLEQLYCQIGVKSAQQTQI